MKKQYKIKDTKEDPLDTVIERSGLTAEFTLRDLNTNIARADKVMKELQGKHDIESAKMANIESYHPFVKDMSDQDINTTHMYAEAKEYVRQATEKMKEVEAVIEADTAQAKIVEELLNLTPANVPQE